MESNNQPAGLGISQVLMCRRIRWRWSSCENIRKSKPVRINVREKGQAQLPPFTFLPIYCVSSIIRVSGQEHLIKLKVGPTCRCGRTDPTTSAVEFHLDLDGDALTVHIHTRTHTHILGFILVGG